MPKVQTARGGKASFEFSGASEKLFGEHLEDFAGEIKIVGAVEDVGRCFVVRGQIFCKRNFICDRCLTKSTREQVHDFEEEFDKSEAVDELLDVTELLRDELLAMMDRLVAIS